MMHGKLKRIFALFMVLAMCLSVVPAAAFAEEPCEHDYVSEVTEPTCTEGGYTTFVCSFCGDSYTAEETHQSKEVEAVASTCTTHGHSAGAVCAVCGEILEGCEELPLAAHEPEEVAAVAPTCTRPGHTAGAVCAVCGEVLEGCEEIPTAEHTSEDVEAVSPTLDKPGRTAGTVCSVCGEVLSGCEEIPATGVGVIFRCGETDNLSGLSVYDAEGEELAPVTDAESGETVAGRYLLAPGTYTYRFRDSGGRWQEVEETEFTVTGESETQEVALELTSAISYGFYSFTYVNPLYTDVIDESSLSVDPPTEDEIAAVFEAQTELGGVRRRDGGNGTAESPYTTTDRAGVGLRALLKARQSDCSFYYTPSSMPTEEELQSMMQDIFEIALQHTLAGDEGDYIRFTYGGWGAQAETAVGQNGQCSIHITYSVTYYTNAEQENAMSDMVTQVLSGLELDGMTQRDKIMAIYSYLCANVTYDYANLDDDTYTLKYSGYAALVNGTAVCQGIANAFYRLCLTAGIDARIINSNTQNHAWNIVKCGNVYYEMDATWDLGQTAAFYGFFMLGQTNWLATHKLQGSSYSTLGDQFGDEQFAADYPIPNADYSGASVSGTCGNPDVNSGENVTWSLSDGVFTVSGTGAMADFEPESGTIDTRPWVEYSREITAVVIEQGVTSVGSHAFFNCPNLNSVTLPAGLTAIGAYAFAGCPVPSIAIPASVTSIGEAAFASCGQISVAAENTAYASDENGVLFNNTYTSLLHVPARLNASSYTVPAGVTEIGASAFGGCRGLEQITLPAGLLTIGDGAFSGCRSLQSMEIPNGVTSIGAAAFSHCEAMTSVTIPATATSLGMNMFLHCHSLQSAVIPAGVTTLEGQFFACCYDLESVTLPEGVTSIGTAAFGDCSSLTEITLPSTVTYIGSDAFRNCSSLASITLPAALETVMARAFSGCSVLTDVYYSGSQADWNTIVISNDDGGNDPLVNATFHYNYAPIAISEDNFPDAAFRTWVEQNGDKNADGVLSGGEIADVTEIDAEEMNIASLSGITFFTNLRKLNVKNNDLTSLDVSAFPHLLSLDCSYNQLTTLTLGNSSGLIVLRCQGNSLSTLDLSGCATLEALWCWDNQSLTQLDITAAQDLVAAYTSGQAERFNGGVTYADGERDLSVADDLAIVSPTYGVRYSANGGTGEPDAQVKTRGVALTLSSTEPSREGYVFLGWALSENAAQPDFQPGGSYTAEASATLFAVWQAPDVNGTCGDPSVNNGNNVTWLLSGGTLTISGTGAMVDYEPTMAPWAQYAERITAVVIEQGVTSVGAYAFFNCPNLSSVTLPAGLTSIGDNAFAGCPVPSIAIPASVTSIGAAAFASCGQISVAAENTAYASDENGALFNKIYTSLLHVPARQSGSYTVPAGVTEIGASAFGGCGDLTQIVLPAGLLTIGNGAFGGCRSLQSMEIPNGVTSIGAAAFNHCEAMTSVTIPATVTSLGANMFFHCHSLQSAVIPAGVTTLEGQSFACCYDLESVVLPEGVTSIGTAAFGDCSSLTEITLPSTVTYIGSDAFRNCSLLARITLPAALETVMARAFSGCSVLTDVYYTGSQADWNTKVTVHNEDNGNDPLVNATFHYNYVPPVAVNESTFPDSGWRAWVLENLDTNNDEQLSDEEINAATVIDLIGQNDLAGEPVVSSTWTSLQGIEFLTQLTKLTANINGMSALDLSRNVNLTELRLDGGLVDMENQTGITYSPLTALDLSRNTELTRVRINGTGLTALDVSMLTKLERLDCAINRSLTSLNVNGCTSLRSITCYQTALTALNTRNCTALKSLMCNGTLLTTLDVSRNTNLETLYCEGCDELTSLTLGTNANLRVLAAEFSPKLARIDIRGCATLANIYSYGARADGDRELWIRICNANNPNPTTPEEAEENPFVMLHYDRTATIVAPRAATESFFIEPLIDSYAVFADSAFRSYVARFDTDHDGILTKAERLAVTEIDCSDSDVQELSSVCLFPELTKLSSNNGHISVLDLSRNTKLTELSLIHNELTALNLSANTALTKLFCNENALATLTLGSKLNHLSCADNQLTALDLSGQDALSTLDCSGNNLATLNLSAAAGLLSLDVSNNNLTALNIIGNTQLLALCCEGNNIGSLNISCCPELLALLTNGTKTETATTVSYNGGIAEINDGAMVVPKQLSYNKTAELITEKTTIPSEAFPDPIFRAWVVQHVDTNGDGALSTSELGVVTEINVADMGIQSLQGIELFPALTTLTCYGNQLTTLDVSQNTELTFLDCGSLVVNPVSGESVLHSNRLTQLTLGSKPSLQKLFCHGNQLTALDLSQAPNLIEIGCSANRLTALDVSALTKLQRLSCADNLLTSLDVRNNPELDHIQCAANRLTSMDFHGMNKLEYVDVSNNQLVSLNLMGCTALELLSCLGNKLATLDLHTNTALLQVNCCNNLLTTLDLSYNTALEGFLCDHNRLTALNVSDLTRLQVLGVGGNQLTSLNLSALTKLRRLHCWGNQLTALNLSANTELDFLQCSGNRLTALDLSNCPRLLQVMNSNPQIGGKGPSGAACVSYGDATVQSDYLEFDSALLRGGLMPDPGVAVNEVNFPDENFRYYVSLNFDTDSSGGLSKAEIAAAKVVAVEGMNIQSLAGIEFLTALENLYCYDNELTALDLSANTNLKLLSIGWVEKTNGVVTETHTNSGLTSLDLSRNTKLTALYVAGCGLTSLDVSKLPNLYEFVCDDNQLTELNLSKNTKLNNLSCDGNQLTSLNLSANTALTGLSANRNQLTALDLSRNTKLKSLSVFSNQLTGLNLSRNTLLETLCCNSNTIETLDLHLNTKLYNVAAENCGLTSLTLGNLNALVFLNVCNNNLTALDLSGTPNLGQLWVLGNQLTDLDVSRTPYLAAAGRGGVNPEQGYDEYTFGDYVLRVDSGLPVILAGEVALNAANFPDANFRSYLSEYFDTNRDGKFSEEELNNVTRIGVPSNGRITSLKGIEFFGNLEILTCYGNRIATLDVSHNPMLTQLVVGVADDDGSESSGNSLRTLDVSRNPLLTLLWCANNQLTALDLSNNPQLTDMNCCNNKLTSLDLSNNSQLSHVNCSNNPIKSLDVSMLTGLQKLSAFKTGLTALDLNSNGALTELRCNDNALTSLDVSLNTGLENLRCSNNKLTALNLNANEALKVLACENNLLTELDLHANTALECVTCFNNKLTTLDLTGLTALHQFRCERNSLRALNLAPCPLLVSVVQTGAKRVASGVVSYSGDNAYLSFDSAAVPLTEDGIPINQANFPDANFRVFIGNVIDGNRDGWLTLTEIAAVDQLNLDHIAIANLKGVEFFYNLVAIFNRSGGKLSNLDVTHNPKLQTLIVSGNILTRLDLSKNPALTVIDVSDNRLTALDVSRNPELVELNCENNQISALNLSVNTELTTLNCFSNRLSTLDLSDHAKLVTVSCDNNNLTALNLSGDTALTVLTVESNKLRALDLSTLTRLAVLECDHNQLAALDLSSNRELMYLDCAYNKLTALDLSTLTNLNYLDCSDNQFTALDLRSNTKLIWLACQRNKLTAVDVKPIPALSETYQSGSVLRQNGTIKYSKVVGENESCLCVDNTVRVIADVAVTLDAYNFPDPAFCSCLSEFDTDDDGELSAEEIAAVTEIDVADMDIASLKGVEFFTALTTLNCSGNALTELDLSGCATLTTVNCSDNLLTALKLPGNGAIRVLNCSGNRLKTLDLSASPALQALNAADNLISALDLSHNPALTELDFTGNLISKLDLSANGALTTLKAGQNRLTVINLSVVPGLETLDISSNRLRGLDLGANGALTELVCDSCGLTALNLSANTALKTLSCSNNSLTVLDLSANTALETIACSKNRLTGLTLGRNAVLYDLACSGNKFSALDVSRCGMLLKAALGGEDIDVEVTTVNGVYVREAYAEGALTARIEHDSSMIFLTSPNSGLCGPKLVWSLSDDGVLSIGGTGAMTQFSAANPAPWNAFAPYIQKIEIGSGVTGIGAYAFAGCGNIEVVLTGNIPGIAATAFTGVTADVHYPGTSSSYTAAKMTNYGGTLTWIPEGGFEIRYDPNGGAFENDPDTDRLQSKRYGEVIMLIDEQPVRPGYVFLGWANAANAAKANYQPGGRFTENANRTLYAVWRAETYTVSFVANCEGTTGAMADQVFSFGKADALRPNAFRKADYAFLGWALAEDAEEPAYKDKASVTDLIAPDSGERTVTLYGVWKPVTRIFEIWDSPSGGTKLSGRTKNVDLSSFESVAEYENLYIRTSEGSSQHVNWTSTAPAVAKVDAEGHVTFLKPGTAIIKASATDGSGLVAQATFNVYYITPAPKLTAKLAEVTECFGVSPAYGLQVGNDAHDSVDVHVYGSDPDTPLDPELFQYDIVTAGGDNYLTFISDGVLEANAPGKTVAVRMTLLGDPLKRSVTLNVKTIPIQTRDVQLRPAGLPFEGAWFVDGAGTVTDDAASAVALYVPSANVARSFTLVPSAIDALWDDMTLAANSFSCATTSAAVASVSPIRSGDELGCVKVTIPARATGACTVTATSTDLAKQSAGFSIYVVDYAPRTDVNTVTVNPYYGELSTVKLTASYGSAVTGVSFLDKDYNRALGHYTDSTGRIAVFLDGLENHEEGEDYTAVIVPQEGIPNSTIAGTLRVEVMIDEGGDGEEDDITGEFFLPLTVRVQAALPRITIRQPQPFNVFYKGFMAELNFSYANLNADVESVELVSDDFELFESGSDYAGFRFKAGEEKANPNPNVKLRFELVGYTFPIEQNFKLNLVTSKPAFKLSASSGVVNTATGSGEARVAVFDEYGSTYPLYDGDEQSGELDYGRVDCWLTPNQQNGTNSIAEIEREGNLLVLKPAEGSRGGRLTLNVQDEAWTSPLSFAYTLSLTAAEPVLTPVRPTLTLNRKWPGGDGTELRSNQADTDLTQDAEWVRGPANMEGRIQVGYDAANGFVWAVLLDNTVPNGTYTYTVKLPNAKAFTIKVAVTNTNPAAKLQYPTLTISGYNQDLDFYVPVSLTQPGLTIRNVQAVPTGTEAVRARAQELFNVEWDADNYCLHLTSHTGNRPMCAGTFTYSVVATVGTSEENEVQLSPVTQTIRLIDDRPALNWAKWLQYNYRLHTGLTEIETWIASDYYGPTTDIQMEAVCTNAKLAAEAEKLIFDPSFNAEGENKFISVKFKHNEPVKAGSYPFNITVTEWWEDESGEEYHVTYKPVPVTVTVVDKKPTVQLTSPTVVLNRDVGLSAADLITLRGDVGFTEDCVFDHFKELEDENGYPAENYENSENVRLTTDADMLYISLTDEARNKTGSPSYPITLTPVVRVVGWTTDGDGNDVKDTIGMVECAPIKLTVRSVSTAARTATVALSGKLDTVLRDTDAGWMTLTLTGFNGVQGIPTDVELIGHDADLFELCDFGVNDKGQFFAKLSLKDDSELEADFRYRANTGYSGLQLRLTYTDSDNGQEYTVYTQKFSVRVTQSAIKLSTPQAAKTFYQSQSRSRWVDYEVKLQSPVGATIEETSVGDIHIWQNALLDVASDILIWTNDEKDTAYVRVYLPDISKLVAGKTYTLPLLVTPVGCAENVKPTTINLTLSVKK